LNPVNLGELKSAPPSYKLNVQLKFKEQSELVLLLSKLEDQTLLLILSVLKIYLEIKNTVGPVSAQKLRKNNGMLLDVD
jgi:hypothetical protein